MHNWYESWFDTEFYHILYEKRNKLEANFFIKNLIEKLQISKNKIVNFIFFHFLVAKID